jgi:hypothetical protein
MSLANFSIMFLTTSTSWPSSSVSVVPSKTLTFLKSVTSEGRSCASTGLPGSETSAIAKSVFFANLLPRFLLLEPVVDSRLSRSSPKRANVQASLNAQTRKVGDCSTCTLSAGVAMPAACAIAS